MLVAEAAAAALGDEDAIAVLGEVTERLLGVDVVDHGADRDDHFGIRAAAAAAIGAAAGLAVGALEGAHVAEIGERVQARLGDEVDAAASPAVTAVGPAERDELLAAKADHAAPAVAGLHLDRGFVDEFHANGCP